MAVKGSRASPVEAEKWFNSSGEDLSEGVYLLDFWTYSCINCVKMLPLMQEVHEKFPLTVIGVHTPEFDFEREGGNVRKAIEKHGITYPVALDSDNSTWKEYGNRYWPRQTLVVDGDIKWDHTGEIDPGELEEVLKEHTGEENFLETDRSAPRRKVSPETYLGSKRCQGVNEGGNFRGEKEFSLPKNRLLNQVYLQGRWRQEPEYLEAVEGELRYYYSGSELNLVAHPAGGIRDIKVEIGGRKVDHSSAGKDLRVEQDRSYIRVKKPDIYSVIDGSYGKEELVLKPDPQTRLYTLTFR